jgi:hypothetical protein
VYHTQECRARDPASLREKSPRQARGKGTLRNCALALPTCGFRYPSGFQSLLLEARRSRSHGAPFPVQSNTSEEHDMQNFATRIAKIQDNIEQEQQRPRELKARETAQERKDDTRRKILYGAAFLASVKDEKDERQVKSFEKVHSFIFNSKDRKFLGLAELNKKTNPKEDEESSKESQTPDLPFGDT